MKPCSHCPRWKPPIGPSGPSPAQVLVIGEAPHKHENYRGKVFAGPSGRELDYRYLPLGGLRRHQVAVCNAHACSLPGYRNPQPKDARRCADNHLPRILAEYSPEVVVLLGSVACSLATPSRNIVIEHGIPFIGKIYNWIGVLVPLFHPAAGMRDSRIMIALEKDFPVLRKVLEEQLEGNPAEDPYSGSEDYSLVLDPGELAKYLKQGDRYKLALDTETISAGSDPNARVDAIYMVSLSNRPGTGRVIPVHELLPGNKFDKLELLSTLGSWIEETGTQVLLHNSLFDYPVLTRLAIHIKWKRVRDTMIDAYHTGWMPHGLKALSWRFLGVRMSEYKELVTQYSRKDQLRYLWEVSKNKKIPQPYLAPRQWKAHRKALTAVEACYQDEELSPQERFLNWPEEDQEAIQATCGPWPWSAIDKVPLDKAVWYACQDADCTYRIEEPLTRELNRIREMV
jgi:uracil-DNA glycosylase